MNMDITLSGWRLLYSIAQSIYSVFAGSITKKGTFSESLFKMACTVFVLPVPLIPDSKVCLDSKFTGSL